MRPKSLFSTIREQADVKLKIQSNVTNPMKLFTALMPRERNVSPEMKLLATVWLLDSKEIFLSVGDHLLEIKSSTLHQIILTVADVMLPGQNEYESLSEGFERQIDFHE